MPAGVSKRRRTEIRQAPSAILPAEPIPTLAGLAELVIQTSGRGHSFLGSIPAGWAAEPAYRAQ